MNHTLEIDGVQLQFAHRFILSDVYVRCDTGSITGLLGRNGSGKSCFMQVAFGTMQAYTRSVRCNGKHIRRAYTVPGLLNYLPQFHFIPASMKVTTALKYYGIAPQTLFAHFPEYEPDMHKTMEELSGGQRRMIELSIILLADTKFSILDEPFTHIMPLHVESIIALMQTIKHRKGIIVTDHMYKHILQVSDTLYLLNNGKTHLISHPNQLVQHGYVSHILNE
ncbi:MAG TPA: ABC transporter ATP-binding protein [Flavipsychrobacter sp.]